MYLGLSTLTCGVPQLHQGVGWGKRGNRHTAATIGVGGDGNVTANALVASLTIRLMLVPITLESTQNLLSEHPHYTQFINATRKLPKGA